MQISVSMQCGDFTGGNMAALDNQISVLRRLSSMCQLHSAVMEPNRQQWRDSSLAMQWHLLWASLRRPNIHVAMQHFMLSSQWESRP